VLSIHFFTIVLNGKPFILEHINRFLDLDVEWHWHIVEGVADLVHDTAWSRSSGGSVSDLFHRHGLSADGTTEYLDSIYRRHPERITIYRPAPGTFWQGKLEMVSAPLKNINQECILWQIDSDELWTSSQIMNLYNLFVKNPHINAARYFCTFLVGPTLRTNTINTYGNHARHGEWLRTWRYRPGDYWLSHEPPRLCRQAENGDWQDVASLHSLSQDETAACGLIFRHYAYCTRMQLAFKESYYGYKGAVSAWESLQEQKLFPLKLSDFFPWVKDHTTVIPFIETYSIRSVLLIRTDALGDGLLSSSMIPEIRNRFPQALLTVICRSNLAELYENCPHVDSIIPIDQNRAKRDSLYRRIIINKIRALSSDLALYSAWSRDALGDELTLSSEARISMAHDGDLCNISSAEKLANNQCYTILAKGPDTVRSELQRDGDFLGLLGISPGELIPKVWTTKSHEQEAEAIFSAAGLEPSRTVALFVSGTWRGKSYIHYPQALSGVLQENGFTVLALGEERDRQLNEDLITKLGVPGVNLAGNTSIRLAAELLRRCRMAIGIDTGLAHLACAVGTPQVLIVGGYQFGRYFPYSNLTSVACLPLECWQCNGKCRYQRAHCVFDLEPKVLESAVRESLSGADQLPRIFIQGESLWRAGEEMPYWKPFHTLFSNSEVRIFNVEA